MIGIDIGVTSSKIAYDGIVISSMRNCVLFEENGEFKFGEEAEKAALFSSGTSENAPQHENQIFEATRLLGSRYKDPEVTQYKSKWQVQVEEIDGKPAFKIGIGKDSAQTRFYGPDEIVSGILKELIKKGEHHFGTPLTAVLTVPPKYNDAQRQLMKDCAAVAGLNVSRVINETVAVAIAYSSELGFNHCQTELPVLVFDLGGSTLRVCVLIVEEGIFEVRSTAENLDLGGNLFDEKLAEHVAFHVKRKYGKDIARNELEMRRLNRYCESAKKILSKETSVEIALDSLVDGFPVSRELLNVICEELFSKCIECVDKALKDAKLEKEDVAHVLLSGGGSNMPKIQEILHDYFGKEPRCSIPPEQAVAVGASIQSLILGGHGQSNFKSVDWHKNGPGLYCFKNLQPMLVPLQKIKSEIQIRQGVYEVTMIQEYVNNEEVEIEAKYVFPMDDQAAVCGFCATIQGRKIEGIVKPKEEAKQEYNEAISQGHGAYLLEQASPDVFELSVGNIPPGVEVEVSITYVAPLRLEDTKVVFTLPLAVLPRYDPLGHISSLSRPSGSSKEVAQYTMEISVLADMESQISSVTSPSHSEELIDLRTGETTLEVHLRSAQPLNRDFVLVIEQTEGSKPMAATEFCQKSNTKAVCISFVPNLMEGHEVTQPRDIRSEMIFVIDRSGSMSGSPIQAAKRTLLDFLQILQQPEYSSVMFNIVGFGSAYDKLFHTSIPLRVKKHLRLALKYANSLEADMGGTEILGALRDIFSKPPRLYYTRQVFLLTDGAVSNTDKVIALVKENSDTSRMFSFGIGPAASRDLVNGIARAGGGYGEFIHNYDDMTKKVNRQLKRALQPAVTQLQIDWGGLDVIQSPHKLRPLFDLEPYQVYGILKEEKEGEVEKTKYDVVLKGFLNARPVQFPVSVNFTDPPSGRAIHSLAAREAIRDLSEETSAIHSNFPATEGAAVLRELVKKEIIRLGVSYNLLSEHTSFIAIEYRPEEGEIRAKPLHVPKRRDVPQYQPTVDTGCLLLLDVTPLSLGVAVPGGVMKTMISRNTTIPCKRSECITFKTDDDGKIVICIYEGERPKAENNNLLDKLEVASNDLSVGPQQVVDVDMTFDLDANGILTISLCDPVVGRVKSLIITNDSGRLSADEIEAMVSTAENFREQDIIEQKRLGIINQLECISGKTLAKIADSFTAVSKWLFTLDVDSDDKSDLNLPPFLQTVQETVMLKQCASSIEIPHPDLDGEEKGDLQINSEKEFLKKKRPIHGLVIPRKLLSEFIENSSEQIQTIGILYGATQQYSAFLDTQNANIISEIVIPKQHGSSYSVILPHNFQQPLPKPHYLFMGQTPETIGWILTQPHRTDLSQQSIAFHQLLLQTHDLSSESIVAICSFVNNKTVLTGYSLNLGDGNSVAHYSDRGYSKNDFQRIPIHVSEHEFGQRSVENTGQKIEEVD